MRKFGHFCYPDSYCAALPWRGAFWRKIMFEFTGMLVSQNSIFFAKVLNCLSKSHLAYW